MNGEASYERWQLDGWKSRRCPRTLITKESQAWLDLYSHYVKGHLYRAGGVEDQPALYLEAMRIIAGYVAEAEDDDDT